MSSYIHVVFFSLIGGLVSLAGGALLLSRKSLAAKLAIYATPFAAGALLAAVFMDLLPEGMHEAPASTVLTSALVGIVLFFFAERFLRWFHHHHEFEPGHEPQADPSVALIVAGDTLHNAIDGAVIGAAFLVSIPTGIVTTLAVAAHEIPQEIGDFGLLLSKGMRRRNVLLVNLVSALATVVTALTVFGLGSEKALPLGVLLGLSSGFLLYIALSDVIPTIHARMPKGVWGWQPLLLLLGIIVVGAGVTLAHGAAPHAEGADDHAGTHLHEDAEDVHAGEQHAEEAEPGGDWSAHEEGEHHHE